MTIADSVQNRDHHEDVYVALREAFRAARRQLNRGRGRHGPAAGKALLPTRLP
jgi:ribosome-associated translation inhibitor RaiA